MTAQHAALLERIRAFDIDGGEAAMPFVARLAREQGWTRRYAERVIEEYRRFVFLAIIGTAPVCPSEDVDAAWHLHLTYTRSYWQRFCGEVLGRPLHHDPTRGGPAEGEKHVKMYADTLQTYRAAFGHDVPNDIWPPSVRRFGEDTRRRVVNTARNWVIPKAPLKRMAALTLTFALVTLLIPGCNGGVNPFTMKNGPFLARVAFALIAAVVAGRFLRALLHTPNPRPEDDDIEPDWEETAYLAGGARRLTTAAIARLVGRGLARVSDDGKQLTVSGSIPENATAVEKAVLRALPVGNDRIALSPVQDAAAAAFAPRSTRMEEERWVLKVSDQSRIFFGSLIPVALVLLCLVLPRLVLGLIGNHPVEYLIMLSMIGGFFAAVLSAVGTARLSNRGKRILAKQKERNEPLRSGALWQSTADAGMAVALFGTAVLAGTLVSPLQSWYPRATGEASASGCGSGGGCGSGCGGGDGGGGCGGGCGGGGD